MEGGETIVDMETEREDSASVEAERDDVSAGDSWGSDADFSTCIEPVAAFADLDAEKDSVNNEPEEADASKLLLDAEKTSTEEDEEEACAEWDVNTSDLTAASVIVLAAIAAETSGLLTRIDL